MMMHFFRDSAGISDEIRGIWGVW